MLHATLLALAFFLYRLSLFFAGISLFAGNGKLKASQGLYWRTYNRRYTGLVHTADEKHYGRDGGNLGPRTFINDSRESIGIKD